MFAVTVTAVVQAVGKRSCPAQAANPSAMFLSCNADSSKHARSAWNASVVAAPRREQLRSQNAIDTY